MLDKIKKYFWIEGRVTCQDLYIYYILPIVFIILFYMIIFGIFNKLVDHYDYSDNWFQGRIISKTSPEWNPHMRNDGRIENYTIPELNEHNRIAYELRHTGKLKFLKIAKILAVILFILFSIGCIKRLHDRNKSAWYILLVYLNILFCYPLVCLFPFLILYIIFISSFFIKWSLLIILFIISQLFWIIELHKKGDIEDNKYGKSPYK